MAGSGYKTFVAGQALTAAQVQGYLQDQAVQVYASTAARSSALGTAVSEGMVSYRTDENALEMYTGSQWETVRQPQVAGKNVILNSDFSIWQRGTSFTGSVSFTADRWFVSHDGSTSVNVTQQTFTPGSAPVSGYESQFYMRMIGTVVSGANYYAAQRIEDVRTFAGQTVTLSYWAKSSATITNYPLYVQSFGTGGSSAVVVNLTSHSIGTTWQRYSQTFTMPSIAGKTIGTSSLIELQPFRTDTSATVDIWGVQLEAGSVATPFSRNASSIQGELAACQRYYYRMSASLAYSQFSQMGFADGTTTVVAPIAVPVTMRVAPTSVEYSAVRWGTGTGGGAISALAISGNQNGAQVPVLSATSTGLTSNNPYRLMADNNAAAYIGISAEL